MGEEKKQQHFVLVHGACHGAWCWYKVKPLLEAAGHRVTALDLAASGIDTTRSITEISTCEQYSEPLIQLIASLPSDEKVVLVGHSFGGYSLAMAMDKFPDKISGSVFVTAFMPDTKHSPSFVVDKILSLDGNQCSPTVITPATTAALPFPVPSISRNSGIKTFHPQNLWQRSAILLGLGEQNQWRKLLSSGINGVDLGLSKTGIEDRNRTFRPLTVLKSRGQKLETRLLEIAEEKEVDEFIIELPRSFDGKETVQSNKVRSVAERLAVQAAER